MKTHRLSRFALLIFTFSLAFSAAASAKETARAGKEADGKKNALTWTGKSETVSLSAAKKLKEEGWYQTAKGKFYYINGNGKRVTGWGRIDGRTYYFDSKGIRQTGWLKLKKKYYYLDEEGVLQTGWVTIGNTRYYLDPITGSRVSGDNRIDKLKYHFTDEGELLKNQFLENGRYVDADGKTLQRSTLKKFLQIALQPVGSTMYVWGGGWEGNGSGKDAVTMGVSPQWELFFKKQGANYDYNKTRYQSENGLDCSGFVGWAIYNAFNTTSGNAGYVMFAQQMATAYAAKGWGSYTPPGSVTNYRAGDIMSTSAGHVYIVIGQCSDGSVVLVHSSPKGVQINGTTTRFGATSQAISLATKYMKKYFPAWYKKYPSCSRGASYLTDYGQMRWYTSGSHYMMTDPDQYAGKSPEAILRDLLGPA